MSMLAGTSGTHRCKENVTFPRQPPLRCHDTSGQHSTIEPNTNHVTKKQLQQDYLSLSV